MPELTEDQFREEALAFLDANAKPKEEERKFVWGEGTDKVAVFEEKSRKLELDELRVAKEWRAKKYNAGFGWVSGPKEYGGRELPPAYERLWNSLESKYDVPAGGFFGIGLGMVAPTILAHANPEVKDDLLPK